MAKLVRKYTTEFKEEAVNLAIKSRSIIQVAKELDIPGATLHTWINQLKKQVPTSQSKSEPTDIAKLLEENRRLHKENLILKEEKDILKKAASYFAQHQK